MAGKKRENQIGISNYSYHDGTSHLPSSTPPSSSLALPPFIRLEQAVLACGSFQLPPSPPRSAPRLLSTRQKLKKEKQVEGRGGRSVPTSLSAFKRHDMLHQKRFTLSPLWRKEYGIFKDIYRHLINRVLRPLPLSTTAESLLLLYSSLLVRAPEPLIVSSQSVLKRRHCLCHGGLTDNVATPAQQRQ